MVGLTVIAASLLILNLSIFKKNKRAARQIKLKDLLDKELVFLRNCELYNLSAREIDVLRLILEGHTYRSAADILFISEKTVDTHLRSIYNKTTVKNKIELVNKFYS